MYWHLLVNLPFAIRKLDQKMRIGKLGDNRPRSTACNMSVLDVYQYRNIIMNLYHIFTFLSL